MSGRGRKIKKSFWEGKGPFGLIAIAKIITTIIMAIIMVAIISLLPILNITQLNVSSACIIGIIMFIVLIGVIILEQYAKYKIK